MRQSVSEANKSMNVLHISRADARCGASRAAYNLHTGLIAQGIDSQMFLLNSVTNDSTVKVFVPPADPINRLRRLIYRTEIEYDRWRYRTDRTSADLAFRDDRCKFGSSLFAQLPPCDLFTMHETSWFVDYRSFFYRASQLAPIVWYLSDMLPLTGGCQIALDCERFLARCGNCPQLDYRHEEDVSHQIWKRKESAYRSIPKDRLHFVAPSKWLLEQSARSSLVKRFPVTIIPCGVNVDEFVPRGKQYARAELGIPQDVSVLLFVASDLGSRLKGFELLAEAVRSLTDTSNLMVVSVGAGIPEVNFPCPHRALGEIHSDRLLSLVYSSADLLSALLVRKHLGKRFWNRWRAALQ